MFSPANSSCGCSYKSDNLALGRKPSRDPCLRESTSPVKKWTCLTSLHFTCSFAAECCTRMTFMGVLKAPKQLRNPGNVYMGNDYFVSKKPGKRSLNNFSVLHLVFIDVGCMSSWRCFVPITLRSSPPSAHTYARVYTSLREIKFPLTRHHLAPAILFPCSFFTSKTPKSYLRNLPSSST